MNKAFFLGTGLLAGTIIGAGIFSLPYIFSRVGFGLGVIYMLVFAFVYSFVHFMYARLVYSEKGNHQFFYLAEKYLSPFVSKFASFVILGELVLVLTVYLILAPTFAEILFPGFYTPALFVFWFLGSVFMFARLQWLGWAEFLGTLSIFAVIAVIFFTQGTFSQFIPFFHEVHPLLLFFPFGPILFSLAGRPAIGKVVDQYKKAKNQGKRFSLGASVFAGTFVPACVYILFALGVLRLNPAPTPDALSGLSVLSPSLVSVLGVMGLITLWTSYFMIGINIRDIFKFDLRFSNWISVCFAVFTPLVLYFLGFRNFIQVLSFTGGVFLALESIFVIAMWQRAFPDNKWRHLAWLLYPFFIVALGYEIVHFIGS